MKPDSLLQSLFYGRLAATVASTAVTGVSLAGLAGWINDATLVVTAILGLLTAIATALSKLREIIRGRDHGAGV